MSDALVDRESELRPLREAIRRAADGRGGAVLVEGEPGIGKTELLDIGAREAAGLGVRVLRGAGEDRSRRLPFATVLSCVDGEEDARVRLGGLVRGEGTWPAGAADQEYAVAEAVLDLVDHWCAAGPVGLFVDDLQWADPASRLVLSRLGTALDQLPLLLVAAYQPGDDEVDLLVRRLRARGAIHLPLGPLDEAAIAALVARLVDGVPDQALLDRVAGAAGNPLYVTELVRDRGTSLAEAVTRRLDQLSEPTRELLGVAAVLGAGFTLTELSTVLGTPVVALWHATGEAVRAGLLIESGDRLAFRHDLIRQALADGTPRPVRDGLLRQAGEALATAGAPVERVAELFAAGGALDARTVEWLSSAADRLIVRAPELAVDLLERSGPTPELRPALARALLWVRRPGDAERVVSAAIADGDPAPELPWLLARAHFQDGRLAQAAREAERAAQEPGPYAARLYGLLAQCRLLLGQPGAASRAAARADKPFGLYVNAWVSQAAHRPDDGIALADQALATLGTADVPLDLPIAPHLVRGLCLVDLDRLDEADAAFELGLRDAGRSGYAFLTWHHLGRAWVRYLDGRWDDALAEIDGALEVVDPLGTASSLRALAAVIALHRGTGAEVPGPGRADEPHALARALAAEREGFPDRALDALLAYPDLPDVARLALATDRTDVLETASSGLARAVYARDATALLAVAQEATRPLDQGYAFECAAVVLGGSGRPVPARTALNSALDRYERLDASADTARGEAYLRRLGGRRRRARPRPRTGWAALTATERKVAKLVAEGLSNPDIAEQMYLSRRTVQSHVSSILAKLGLTSRVELAVSALTEPDA